MWPLKPIQSPQASVPEHNLGGEFLGAIALQLSGKHRGSDIHPHNNNTQNNKKRQRENPQTQKSALLLNASSPSPQVLIGLYGVDCPIAVTNFIQLCEFGFYNGAAVTRVKRDHWVEIGGPIAAAGCNYNNNNNSNSNTHQHQSDRITYP